MAKRDPCEGCVYRTKLGFGYVCDYLCMTGQRRPCPFGEGCTVKETETNMSRKQWDKQMALELYKQGKSDNEIGKALGISTSTVLLWRKNNRFKPNYGPDHRKAKVLSEPEPEVQPEPDAPPEQEVPPEPEPELPAPSMPPNYGPVELSVELKGSWARLRAPNWEQAAKLWKMLDVCVGTLRGGAGDEAD